MQVFHLLSSNSRYRLKSNEGVSYFEVKSYQLLVTFIILIVVVSRITIRSYLVKVRNFHPVLHLFLEIPPKKKHHNYMLDLCMNPQQNRRAQRRQRQLYQTALIQRISLQAGKTSTAARSIRLKSVEIIADQV